jgi:hypothetical protein
MIRSRSRTTASAQNGIRAKSPNINYCAPHRTAFATPKVTFILSMAIALMGQAVRNPSPPYTRTPVQLSYMWARSFTGLRVTSAMASVVAGRIPRNYRQELLLWDMQHGRKGRSGMQEANWQTSMLRNLSAAQCMNIIRCRGLHDIYLDELATIPPVPLQNMTQLSNGKTLATDVIFTTMSNVNAALSSNQMQDYCKKTQETRNKRCTLNNSR